MISARTANQSQAKNRARFRGHVHTGETWNTKGEFEEARKIYKTLIDRVRRFERCPQFFVFVLFHTIMNDAA